MSALVAVILVLAGCSDRDSIDLQDPGDTPSTVSESSSSSIERASTDSPTASAEQQAVLDAYYAFYEGLAQANADPVNSEAHLQPVATGRQFEVTNAAIKADLLAGEEGFGRPVLSPRPPSIEGDTAVVQDCQDTSAVGTRRIGTTDPITIGRNPDSAETTLQMVDGTWKVAATSFQADPAVFCG